MTAKSTNLNSLEKYAETIREELKVPKQNEVFQVATEAGYLTALADGELDESERTALIKAIEVLSVGAIIEWELETLLDQCKDLAEKEGATRRAEVVGTKLKELGQPEPGVLFAAFIAQATGGIDKKETAVLQTIGKAAGLAKNRVNAILKKVGAEADAT